MFADWLQQTLAQDQFHLPAVFDLGATFFFALTGALAAMKRRYDWVGVLALALLTGVGGSLLRDGLFLQQGPPAVVRDGRFLLAILAGCVGGAAVGNLVDRFRKVVAVLDAVGLCAYGVVGAQKALAAGLSLPAAVLVGVVNACGGGLLRDLITREEPLVFKPGQFYVLASLLGCVLFVLLAGKGVTSVPLAALLAMTATFLCRILAIVFNWRTSAVQPWLFEPGDTGGAAPPPHS